MKDILEVLEDYIPEANPPKWAKLSSEVEYRRLTLLLLREILCELRKLRELILHSNPQTKRPSHP